MERLTGLISRDVKASDKRAAIFEMLEALGNACITCLYKNTKFCENYCPENQRKKEIRYMRFD